MTAELDNDAVQGSVFLFDPQDFHYGFHGQGFEIQTIRCVIIGGHSFWVTVDHDCFVTRRRQGVTGVATAVIEFNSLTDAVGAAAKNDDFLFVGWPCFAFDVAHGVRLIR